MSSSAPEPSVPEPSVPDDDARCPCTSGLPFGACCGPALDGSRPAPTAQALMRSRFTAFALGDAAYLRASWDPATRPEPLELDSTLRWYRLDVLRTALGQVGDDVGTVEFVAYHRGPEGRGSLHEVSRFRRGGAGWLYVDGDVA